MQLTPIRVGRNVAARGDLAQSSVNVELAEAPSPVTVIGTAADAMGQENDSLASPEPVVVKVARAWPPGEAGPDGHGAQCHGPGPHRARIPPGSHGASADPKDAQVAPRDPVPHRRADPLDDRVEQS